MAGEKILEPRSPPTSAAKLKAEGKRMGMMAWALISFGIVVALVVGLFVAVANSKVPAANKGAARVLNIFRPSQAASQMDDAGTIFRK